MRFIIFIVLALCTAAPAAACEPESSLWDHNGSTMRLEGCGPLVRIVYKYVKPELRHLIAPETELASGYVDEHGVVRMVARVFSLRCGVWEYDVAGKVTAGALRFSLSGRAPMPVFDARLARCVDARGGKDVGQHDILTFDFVGQGE